VVVLALPRGGVEVAAHVAQALGAPLDVIVVRKLGVPGREELAMGAIAGGGECVLNREIVTGLGIARDDIETAIARETVEVERREREYRGDRPRPDLAGRVAVLVDDGLATGSTMHAAVRAVRREKPAEIIVAVPTAPPAACSARELEADEVVCVRRPRPFLAVGLSYDDFTQTSDDRVRDLLAVTNVTRKSD
jgi:predicted phosphoribosyltransferase